MPMLTKPSAAARMSLLYITVGALLLVWTGVYFAYLYRNPPAHDYVWYLSTAILLTGATLLIIGLALGKIGRAARHAELPPPEATPAVAATDQKAAQSGMVAPPLPTAPVAPNGAVPASPAVTPVAAPVPAQPVRPVR
jgi:hypothetical protein